MGSELVNMLGVEYPNNLPMERIYQMLTRGLYKNMMQMINRGLLRVETIIDDKVFMIKMSDKEVCWVQFTPGGSPN